LEEFLSGRVGFVCGFEVCILSIVLCEAFSVALGVGGRFSLVFLSCFEVATINAVGGALGVCGVGWTGFVE
jgi:hypothetical protein